MSAVKKRMFDSILEILLCLRVEVTRMTKNLSINFRLNQIRESKVMHLKNSGRNKQKVNFLKNIVLKGT